VECLRFSRAMEMQNERKHHKIDELRMTALAAAATQHVHCLVGSLSANNSIEIRIRLICTQVVRIAILSDSVHALTAFVPSPVINTATNQPNTANLQIITLQSPAVVNTYSQAEKMKQQCNEY